MYNFFYYLGLRIKFNTMLMLLIIVLNIDIFFLMGKRDTLLKKRNILASREHFSGKQYSFPYNTVRLITLVIQVIFEINQILLLNLIN